MDSPSNLRVRLLGDQENPPSNSLAHNSLHGAAGSGSVWHESFRCAGVYNPNSNGVRSSTHSAKIFPVDQQALEGGVSPKDGEPPVSSSPRITLAKKLLSEFMGTFVLVFVGVGAGIANEITGGSVTFLGCAIAGGLAVMAIVFTIGHVSGAHINPSVTLAFASLRQFPWLQVPLYITAQLLGSISASYILKAVFHSDMHSGMTLPQGGYTETFILEFLISCILMFVITSVATDTRALGEMTAIAVGITVLFNALLAGAISGGSMNPARSIGPAVAANDYDGIWLYIVAPTLGMQVGAGAYTLIRL